MELPVRMNFHIGIWVRFLRWRARTLREGGRTAMLCRAGWTMIELILMAAIIATLAALAAPRLQGALDRANVAGAIVEIAVWNVASRILPNSRHYVPLREEIDRFIQLARRLNSVAVSLAKEETVVERKAFDLARDDMRESVQRMVGLAGKVEHQPDHQPAVVDLTRADAVTSEDTGEAASS